MRIKRMLAALMAICLIALCAPVPGAEAGSKYEIRVDLTNQIVTVYEAGKIDDAGIVRQMICSSGRSATPTPKGTFYLPSRSQSQERSEWYYFPKFKCYAKWATRIRGGILFHSTLFTSAKRGPTSSSTRALGSKASHGCIRLKVEDAKFIAKNCPAGTKCKIYASGKVNSSLRSKLKKKSFSRDNQTYDSYLGRAPSRGSLPLKKGSTGTLVSDLQTRLRALGFYTGKINGRVGNSTIKAVKNFQSASGLKKTSRVTQATWDRIFADNAATGTLVTLTSGSNGPAVKVMQQNLITLLMLSGSADGNFGSQTASAVKKYQRSFGFSATGSADTALQKDIASRAARVKNDFGSDPYALDTVTVDAKMAKVKPRSGAKLRKSASTRAKVLKKLKRNTAVRVLSEGKTWTKVQYGGNAGYVKRSSLSFYTEKVDEATYVKVAATPVPTPSPTPAPTPEPTPTPSPTPVVSLPQPTDTALLAACQAVAIADGTPVYAEKDASTLQATVPEGSAFDVVADDGVWIAVSCGDVTRYVRAESVQLAEVVPVQEEISLEAAGAEMIYGTEPSEEVEAEVDEELEIETEIEPVPADETDIYENEIDIPEDEPPVEDEIGLDISED